MMNYYLYFASEKYAGLSPFDEDLTGGMKGPESLAYRVFLRGQEPPPLDEYIKPLRVRPYIEVSRKTRSGGDFVSEDPMILSQRAVDSLREMLESCGVLYPLEAHDVDQPYWLYYVTNVIDCLDEDRSVGSECIFPELKRRFSSILSFALDHGKVDGLKNYLFRVPNYRYTFVNDVFRLRVEEVGLTGVKLIPENANRMMDPKSAVYLNNTARLENKKRSQPIERIEKKVLKALNEKAIDRVFIFSAELEQASVGTSKEARRLVSFWSDILCERVEPGQYQEFESRDFSELKKSVAEMIRLGVVRARADERIKAFYIEYTQDGQDFSLFLCDDFAPDEDTWQSSFLEDGIISGPEITQYVDFDPDCLLEEDVQVIANRYVNASLLAIIVEEIEGLRPVGYPVSFAQHDCRPVLITDGD